MKTSCHSLSELSPTCARLVRVPITIINNVVAHTHTENARMAVDKEGGLELFGKMLQEEEDDLTVDALSAVGVLLETST